MDVYVHMDAGFMSDFALNAAKSIIETVSATRNRPERWPNILLPFHEELKAQLQQLNPVKCSVDFEWCYQMTGCLVPNEWGCNLSHKLSDEGRRDGSKTWSTDESSQVFSCCNWQTSMYKAGAVRRNKCSRCWSNNWIVHVDNPQTAWGLGEVSFRYWVKWTYCNPVNHSMACSGKNTTIIHHG